MISALDTAMQSSPFTNEIMTNELTALKRKYGTHDLSTNMLQFQKDMDPPLTALQAEYKGILAMAKEKEKLLKKTTK